jgi:hypothetical protein
MAITSRRLKFYVGHRSELAPSFKQLNPLLRGEAELRPDGKQAAYVPQRTDRIEEADFVTTAKVWSAYAATRDLVEPLALAEEARHAGKRFLIWHTGDLNPILPSTNWIVLTNAIDRSRRAPGWFVAPRFIDDPLRTYSDPFAGSDEGKSAPRVGFCGYASSGTLKLAYSVLQNLKFHAMYRAGRTIYEAPRLIPATLLRAKVLTALESDSSIESDFIIRTRYRTGSTEAFYRNIMETDYTVCVRGYGNWSVRFYETLACGRIPIFIDTDSCLPFDGTIDWRRYCVWVPEADASRVGDYVREFHNGIRRADFRARQRECRTLWEARLSLPGFLSHLYEIVTMTSSNTPERA